MFYINRRPPTRSPRKRESRNAETLAQFDTLLAAETALPDYEARVKPEDGFVRISCRATKDWRAKHG